MTTPVRTVIALVLAAAMVPAAGAAPAGPADRALDRALRKVVQAPGGPPGVITCLSSAPPDPRSARAALDEQPVAKFGLVA